VIGLWLIDGDYCHFCRWIGEVGLCWTNRKLCDVGNTVVINSACVSRIANVEMTVSCVVRIKLIRTATKPLRM
jgi:hypothetical protein